MRCWPPSGSSAGEVATGTSLFRSPRPIPSPKPQSRLPLRQDERGRAGFLPGARPSAWSRRRSRWPSPSSANATPATAAPSASLPACSTPLKDRARLTLITREWDRRRGLRCWPATRFISAAGGATGHSPATSAACCEAGASTSCSRTSASPAAIFTVPATACTASGLKPDAGAGPARAPGRGAQSVSPLPARRRAAVVQSPRLRAVVCNSRLVRDEIKRHFGLADDKLHVIYSGVDTAAYHPDLKRERAAVRASLGFAPAVPLFLFVGSGFERKGSGGGAYGAGAPAARRSAGDRARPACRALSAPGGRFGSCRARTISRRIAGCEALLRRRRCAGVAHALRSISERGTGGHGLRPARRHQHHERRRQS